MLLALSTGCASSPAEKAAERQGRAEAGVHIPALPGDVKRACARPEIAADAQATAERQIVALKVCDHARARAVAQYETVRRGSSRGAN